MYVRKLEQLLHCVGYNPTIREMRDYMFMLETSDPDEMTFDEFIALMKKVEKKSGPPQDQYNDMVRAFKKFDKDGSNFLDRDEIKEFLCKRGVEEVSQCDVDYVLTCADMNGDGRIDIDEFSKLLTSF